MKSKFTKAFKTKPNKFSKTASEEIRKITKLTTAVPTDTIKSSSKETAVFTKLFSKFAPRYTKGSSETHTNLTVYQTKKKMNFIGHHVAAGLIVLFCGIALVIVVGVLSFLHQKLNCRYGNESDQLVRNYIDLHEKLNNSSVCAFTYSSEMLDYSSSPDIFIIDITKLSSHM